MSLKDNERKDNESNTSFPAGSSYAFVLHAAQLRHQHALGMLNDIIDFAQRHAIDAKRDQQERDTSLDYKDADKSNGSQNTSQEDLDKSLDQEDMDTRPADEDMDKHNSVTRHVMQLLQSKAAKRQACSEALTSLRMDLIKYVDDETTVLSSDEKAVLEDEMHQLNCEDDVVCCDVLLASCLDPST